MKRLIIPLLLLLMAGACAPLLPTSAPTTYGASGTRTHQDR